MTIDSERKVKQRQRAKALLKQGCTTRQVSERTGLSTRSVLRLKEKLRSTNDEGTSG